MKKLLILFLLFFPYVAHGAIAHVQSDADGTNCGSVTTCNDAFGSNTTAGSLLIIAARYGASGRTLTISDTQTNTWNVGKIFVQTNDAPNSDSVQYYAMNTAGGADTVTFAFSGAAATTRIAVSEFSGAATSLALDQTNGAEGTGLSLASGAVVPTTDGQLLFATGFLSGTGAFVAGTDFTLASRVPSTFNQERFATEYYIQPTAASHDGTFTVGGSFNWAATVATYKAAGGAATPSYANEFVPPW